MAPNLRFRGSQASSMEAATALTPPAPRALSPRMQAYVAQREQAAQQETKAAQSFRPSPQQQAYFDWIEKGSGSLVLRAAAGCGKTTTLIEGLRMMNGAIFFGAYNKDIAAEIKHKAAEKGVARPGLYISTLHGSGLNDFSRTYKGVQIDDSKVGRLIDTMAKEPGCDALPAAKAYVKAMVSFAKQFLFGVKCSVDNLTIWAKLSDHFGADQALPGDVELMQALAWAAEIFKRSHAQCTQVIDFDDMIYAPLAYNCRLFKNDWVLLDEAQDVNPARRELAKRMLKPNGRFVAVGDDRQAIYGFTGAGGNAIELIKSELHCAELPLSVTYRCPKSVVEYLYRYVPRTHIEAHPSAPEGMVRSVKFETEQTCPVCNGNSAKDGPKCDNCNGSGKVENTKSWFEQDPLEPTDVILCRYNAPLLSTAFALIRSGIACKVAGRDIGKGLMVIARMWKISTLAKLEERLEAYLERELQKAAAKEDDRRAQEVTDKVDCLRIFIARCRKLGKTTIDDLEREIEAVFSDQISGMVTLSSGHKAKGKEWPRVFWIQCDQRGQPGRDWEMEQEINVQYVIGSRVKADKEVANSGTLILVPEALTKGESK